MFQISNVNFFETHPECPLCSLLRSVGLVRVRYCGGPYQNSLRFGGMSNSHMRVSYHQSVVSSTPPPPPNITCPLKRDHLKKDVLSSNLQFSGDMLLFRVVRCYYLKCPIKKTTSRNASNDHANCEDFHLSNAESHPMKILVA